METKMNFVDLGLPSGTLWADRNVGAEQVYQPGVLVPKAEAQGNLPSYDQAVELIKICDFSSCLLANEDDRMVNSIRVEGPNGNAIFFPCSAQVDEAGDGLASSVWVDSDFGATFSAFMLFQLGLLGILDIAEITNLTIGMSNKSTLKMVRNVK